MTKLYQVSLLGMALLLFACGKDRIYEEYHSFPSGNWEESDSIKFDLTSLDTVRGQAILGVRYTEDYPFSNCYIKVIYRDSSKVVLEDSLWNVPIFDKQTGKPIGDGFGNTFTTFDTLSFPFPASTREVIFLQYMRQPQLEGIEAVGFKVINP